MNITQFIESIKWLPTIDISIIDIIQILILTFTLYYLARGLYRTRAWILVKGMAIIGIIYIVICLTDMTVLQALLQGVFGTLLIAIVIMFQPELQKIVELIGKKQLTDIKSLFKKKTVAASWYSEKTIYEIVSACEDMGSVKTGALIVLERGIPLTEYIQSGITLSSAVSSQLLINIFEKNTPLHDGAVIIKDNKIESATCYLPLSKSKDIDKNLGTRHRAALGASEESDCVVVVVSEETGSLSFCCEGQILRNLDRASLTKALTEKMYKQSEKESLPKRSRGPFWLKIIAPLIGVIIWLVTITANDPIATQVIQNVPVATVNTEALDDAGQAYAIQSGDVINVVVRGRRSLIDNMTREHLVATADFATMSIVNAVPIKIAPVAGYEDIEILSKSEVMTVQLEELVQIEVPLEIQISGDVDADRVMVVKHVTADVLSVTCPDTLAKTIDKGVLVIDVYGKDNDFIASGDPVLYDKNGEIISSKRYSLANDKILATVDVLQVRTVPVKVVLAESSVVEPDVYYELNGFSVEFPSVRIAADTETFSSFKELVIRVIPEQKGAMLNSVVINLAQHLPDNCYLAKDQADQMKIDLDLIKFQKTSLVLAPENISFSGYDPAVFKIVVKEFPSEILMYCNTSVLDPAILTVEMLAPSAKTRAVGFGELETTLNFTDINGVELIKDYVVIYEMERIDK